MTVPSELMLFRVFYRSQCVMTGSQKHIDAEVERILDVSRTANARAGLTGALMFNSSVFFQVLEGPSDQLEATFERICCDPRHNDIQLIEFNAVDSRAFTEWSMTRVDADPEIETLFAHAKGKHISHGTMTEAAGRAVDLLASATQTGLRQQAGKLPF